MKTVVHITADFPDPFDPDKTAAITNLVSGASGFRHIVYSLNRVDGLLGVTGYQFDDDKVCLIYRAPAKGLLFRRRLDDVAEWILADLKARAISPDVVHAHKFTIEGLVALRIKDSLECPIICNIQGNTDTYIASRRVDVRPTYRRLVTESAQILAFAPWCGPAMQRILGTALPYEVLPVGTTCDRLLTPTTSGKPHLVSLFHLDHWRAKGADTLTSAVTAVARTRPGVTLDIYGDGSAWQKTALEEMIRRRSSPGRVRLMGPLSREQVQQTLNGYSAFVMPSRRETYGMAFVEALFSGTPIVFPRDRAVDGLLPESAMGARCKPSNVRDLGRAIKYVLDNETSLKSRLGSAQSAGALDHLRLGNITARYREILEVTST
jgi:glycosyltransferase involved in cell wall biosynthesis